MARFAFLTWYGAGNQVPEIGAAQALAARGHTVTFLGYAAQRSRFESAGFDFAVLERAEAAYRADEPPERVMAALMDGVWACPAQAADVADHLAGGRYDAVVVDCLMFAALAALEAASTPVAVLVHSAPGALAPPGGPGEQFMLGPVNAAREAAGQAPVANLWQAWAPFSTLCTSIPDLDPYAAQVPASFRYVGPVFERMPAGSLPVWPAGDRRPLVTASFSTGHAWDQTSRIARVIAAARGLDCRLLMLTGTADMADPATPENVRRQAFVPHAQVLPVTAATINHAGHGTIAASLAHGVPMVLLPNPAADQPALAARVAELGAGIALDGEEASGQDIAAAVRAVLTDDSYRQAAKELQEAILGADGNRVIADTLEDLPRSNLDM
ncbi:MAG TPA: nucleotide disphospho-sugar-binding domain-containing protein [Mycobacteriales bacterium]|nr:nucleotide disphospho-sugar-binding domain-containing protein [Mycobacteriales bacterium]